MKHGSRSGEGMVGVTRILACVSGLPTKDIEINGNYWRLDNRKFQLDLATVAENASMFVTDDTRKLRAK